MNKTIKKIMAVVLIVAMAISFFTGCEPKEETEAIVDTIYIGHHYQPEDDPYWVSDITGEPVMDPDKIRASRAALATVKEVLGVDIKWKQWPNGVTQDCLQTVLAGDPYCHIAILSNGFQGRVMVQNVLQPLDQYMDIFDDPDTSWIASGKTFGHHYLLNRDLLYITDWPMVYNATMIEEVPELKDENGNTIYPCDLYEQGKWTWSTFEWYLETIKTYYEGKKAPSGAAIVPYDARYQYTTIQAIHSNGAYLYNGESMAFDTPEAIEACEYLDSLMTRGLVNCVTASFGKSSNPGYLESVNAFARGETVFTNCARWKMGSSSTTLAERGESMGIIFFPRPDDVPFQEYNNEVHNSDYQYKIAISCADSVGLLRGFDEEESRLALEAYALFRSEFYKNYGGVDSIEEYRATMGPTEAINFGVDIFHPEIGDKNLEIFQMLGSLSENEYGEAMNIIWSYGVDTFGASVYGINGSPKYAIKVESRKQSIFDSIDKIGEALKNEGATDAVTPSASQINSSKPIVFSAGTDPDSINWLDIFSASDNVDGKYEMKMENGKIYLKANPELEEDDEEAEEVVYEFIEDAMVIDVSAIDFNTPGVYEKGIKIKTTDTSGNTANQEFNAYIYDANGTKAPALTLKPSEEFGTIALNADTSTVKWADLFVTEAVDENGINLKSFVSADVTELDVTVAGKYPVTIYVKDFAGNKSEQTITVEIKK